MTEKEVEYAFPNEFLYDHLLLETRCSRRTATLQDTSDWVFKAFAWAWVPRGIVHAPCRRSHWTVLLQSQG